MLHLIGQPELRTVFKAVISGMLPDLPIALISVHVTSFYSTT
jgi:hypothetical protein